MSLPELLQNLSQSDDWGLIVYEINKDGCLTGSWSNSKASMHIMNEIARPQLLLNRNDISGTYTCAYIDETSAAFIADLKIIRMRCQVYELIWSQIRGANSPAAHFKGVGLITGAGQFSVFYWDV